MNDDVIQILNLILNKLIEISSQIDQIRKSNQSNLIRSDQIRSDQISKTYANWIDSFMQVCDTYGLPYEGLDLTKIEQGATYFLVNQGKIISKKSYLSKILKDCPRIDPNKKSLVKSADLQEDNLIMGMDPDLIDSHTHLLNPDLLDYFLVLHPNYRSIFGSWDNVVKNIGKSRILTALCAQEGLIQLGKN